MLSFRLVIILASTLSFISCTQENQNKGGISDFNNSSSICKSLLIEKDSSEYSFRDSIQFPNMQISFGKNKDSVAYSTLNINDYYYQINTDTALTLSQLINQLEIVWAIAEHDDSIYLKHASVGYPIEYPDVLKSQIEAFKNSPEWEPSLYKKPLNLDYALIKKIMLEADVYKPLNDFLKTQGYEIADLHLEKHGHVTKERLEKLGYDPELMIPVPFMVWIEVRKY